MNGDGRIDFVRRASPVWEVYLNTGSGFTEQPAQDMRFTGTISYSYKSGTVRITAPDTFDFNGDGLPDKVYGGLVYFNRGLNFDPSPTVVSTTSGLRVVQNSGGLTTTDFLDVNGDGLPDRVTVVGSTWNVELNLGEALAGPVSWPGPAGGQGTIRKNNSEGNTKWDVLDWNGDGFLDRVDGSDSTWTVQLGLPSTGPGIRPYLMTKSYNGLGSLTETRYAPSTGYPNTRLPFATWVVTGTRRTDGLCGAAVSDPFTLAGNPCLSAGHELVSTLEYSKGYFDPAEREFRGFGKVIERFPAESNRYREVEFNQAAHTRGQVEVERVWVKPVSAWLRASSEDFTWATYVPDLSVERTQVYMTEHVIETFDVDTPSNAKQCMMKRNERPDAYGRVTRSCSLACGASAPGVCNATALPVSAVITEVDWADPEANSGVRERPQEVTTKQVMSGGSASALIVKRYFYDGKGAGLVGNGNVTSVQTDGIAGAADAIVTTAYDGAGLPARGNITKVIEPEQHGTSIGTTSTFGSVTSYLFPTTERL